MVTCEGQCIYETPADQIAFRLAVKIRNYLLRDARSLDGPGLLDPESRRRLSEAAKILEGGAASTGLDRLGDITLSELKRRYVVYMVEREEGFRAAARVLAIEPSTVCRIYRRGQVSPNGRSPAHRKPVSPIR